MNSVKEELLKEKYRNVLFHGSKKGLSEIGIDRSRDNCDFGKGFYLGETYSQALSFVCEYERASVYAFRYSLDGLKIMSFDCSLEWMLAICYFRGRLGGFLPIDTVGKIKFSRNALFWIGYMYRYISYTRDMSTKFVMKLFSYKQMNDVYYTFHTQDPEWCVRNLLEMNDLDETIFDRNYRLKEIMRASDKY